MLERNLLRFGRSTNGRSLMLSRNVALALVLICPSIANASLMTFDAVPNETAKLQTWVEDGITATSTGGLIATYHTPGEVHLDAWGTPFASGINFTTGSAFEAGHVVLSTSAAEFCAAPCTDFKFDDPFPYLSIKGFLQDTLVASLDIDPSMGGLLDLDLSSLGVLDRLSIGVQGEKLGLPGII